MDYAKFNDFFVNDYLAGLDALMLRRYTRCRNVDTQTSTKAYASPHVGATCATRSGQQSKCKTV